MTDDLLDLARRAVASPHWRWMPGMLAVCEDFAARVIGVDGEYDPPQIEYARTWRDGDASHPRGFLPDFDDHATRGCLLALVREKIPALAVFPPSVLDENAEWSMEDRDGAFLCDKSSEAAALVAALEAAPAPEEK